MLAEVYLAMTGGQAKLDAGRRSLDLRRARARGRDGPRAARKGCDRGRAAPAADELVAHDRRSRCSTRPRAATRCGADMKLLVTGAAGFIGFHTASAPARARRRGGRRRQSQRLLRPALKSARLRHLASGTANSASRSSRSPTARGPGAVRAGAVRARGAPGGAGRRALLDRWIRISMCRATSPASCTCIEGCRPPGRGAPGLRVDQFGVRRQHPHAVLRDAERRSSADLYAATKKANELMAHSYSSLYGLPTTGLRFFTV